ncbi:SDR family NAD(P)-dependent oxidoreductase [Jiangella mangrovi]|uniref:NAD(P)-dependent dehydrogenase (Short-subunit alcohol dehydrogenase family) n=1 Tax=Jiangella mangrovi TaxID=1524084 RepID=A0A7W9GU13_9ACTN|nr:SDR family NAD(P)-dependent oxidoreductase [Jiangella mangrovi]MBB5790053.1 NAD(P)-dependent dehydrogenase (short-subunit alcohol dehydrogenase family) [Jiangella mangrovi]
MSTFLVTGASRGLGRAVVVAALAAGHQVVAGVRDPHALDDLLGSADGRLVVVPLDVTDPAAAERAVHTVVDEFGRLDVLVNNAGYANLGSIEDTDPADFRAQVETNLFGVVNVTRAALPVLREQRGGHIVQVSSVGGRMASAGLAAYQTAKWAVGGFSSVLAAEVEPLGIRVSVLEPGGMRTDWAGSSMRVDPVRPEYAETVGANAARMGEAALTQASDPAKVAELVLRVVAMDEPPLRLLVGPDAYLYGTAVGRALLAADEQNRELSESTVADDATAEQLDPLGAAQR